MADSKLAFVGTHTDADEDGIFGFRVDEEGILHQMSAVNGGPNPGFLAGDPNGDHLYAANRPKEGGDIVTYTVDRDASALSRLNVAPTKGGGTPCYCSVDATDQCVLTAQYGGGTVSALPIDQGGHVGEPSTVIKHQDPNPNADSTFESHPHSIRPGPDNEYAYAPDVGLDHVFVYEFDPGRATLEPASCGHVEVYAGAEPRHLDFHPNGRYMYLINQRSTVVAFERDAETGTLDPFATVTTLPEDFDGENSCADIHVHPSGDYLYGSNRGHDSIAVFELDANGQPSLIETESTRGEWPRNFAIDPTGTFLFAENADTNSIVTFRIENDGTLNPTGHVTEVPAPVCMQFVE